MGQTIFPMLAYDDAPSAIDFLVNAFGFQEKTRMTMPDGTIAHADLALTGNEIMLATTWKVGGMASPKDLAGLPSQLFCIVEDVERHREAALAAGANVLTEIEEQGENLRLYRALDPEGHRWLFASRTTQ